MIQGKNSGFWSRKSLTTRIALASAFFGFLTSGCALIAGFYALSHQLDVRSTAELMGKRDLLIHVLSEIASLEAIEPNKHRFGDLLIGHDDLHLALVDPVSSKTLTSFSPIATQSASTPETFPVSSTSIQSWTTETDVWLNTIRGISPVANGTTVQYYLSLDRRDDRRLLGGFIKTTLVGWPLLLLVVALGAWLNARTSLAPLRRFHGLAASIGAKSLSQRISSSGLPLELNELAEEFNRMLERIDSGYQRLQDFSGELAHEMRTPIATLMGRTQVALSHPRTCAEFQDILEGNVEELERLSRLISDMLFIARADHNEGPLNHERVELAQGAQRVADYLSLVAEERGLVIEITGTAVVMADRLLVERAITNLLSNAIRHAATPSKIRVEISAEDSITLAVTNSGEVIAPHHLERIFDRFYRIDSGRSRLDGGTGLGLAIVRSIMIAHAGQVQASSSEGGETTFTLIFRASGASHFGVH